MIVRGPRPESRYLIVANDVVRDKRLSFRARGVLVCILSLPDNYRVSAQALQSFTTDGREAIRSALEELRAYGYARTVRQRGHDGRITTTTYVFDRPHPSAQVVPNNGVDNVDAGAQETVSGNLGRSKTTGVQGTIDSRLTALTMVPGPCGQCDGTGWRPTAGDGLERCDHG